MPSVGPRQAAESGSFLKKRTKKLCEFGFGLSWRAEAEIIKSFFASFFQKRSAFLPLVCLCAVAPPLPQPSVSWGGRS
jgi:hypothetical protein